MAIGSAKVGTLKEQASGTSLVATLPAGLAAGDFLTFMGVAASSPTLPTGYTALFTPFSWTAGEFAFGYYKIATGSETAPTLTVTNGRATAQHVAWSGVDNTTPIDVASQTGTVATGNVTLAGLTIVTAGAVMFGAMGIDASTAATITVPSQMTLINTTTGTGRRFSNAWELRAASGATGSRVWTNSSTTLAGGAWLAAMRPAVTAVTPYSGWGLRNNL